MNGAELFIRCLENEGVTHIFGIPGEENLAFLEAMRKSGIRMILTRHEQAAGFMAATYGRLTGKTGVCLSTLGPGATNFVTGTSYAQLGGMPVLFITGQKPISKSKQGRFQILDVVRMMEPITKFSKQIVDANNIPSLVRNAFRIAEEEKPGAVHLELPEDIADELTTAAPYDVTEPYWPAPRMQALEAAARIIEAADHPLLLIAAGANRKKVCPALNAFLEKTGIYFFTTQMGKGVVDERHPQCLGTAALSANDYLHCAIEKADLIINVGHDVVEKPPFFMTRGGIRVVHINYSGAQIDDVYFPQHEVIGDIADSINGLTAIIKKSYITGMADYRKVKDAIETHVFGEFDDYAFPLKPQKIVVDMRNTLPDDAIISLDNGMYKIWFARNYKAYDSNTVLLDNALASMGAGLPVAIAAKMFLPDRQVVAICGDGGFMMNSQEMETAIRLKLDLTVVILKDDAYGMIKWKQTGMDYPSYGLDFGNPDFVKYAESYGAAGYRVEGAGQFTDILKTCLKAPGVHLIEVPVDYSENEKVFIEELKRKTCML